MNKSLSLILIFLIVPFVVFSQTESPTNLPNIIPPSPEVSALFSFKEDNVDESTGHAQISIPLANKVINNKLTYNTSLNYNTSLLKVINASGWTGQGWADNFSNMVSRTVKGYPDEYRKGYQHVTGVLNLPDYWNYNNLSYESKKEFMWKSAGDSADKYDFNQDVFNFRSLGISGSFVLELVNGIVEVKPLELSNKNLKIQINFDYRNSEIIDFKIRDTQNYVHHFTFVENSTTGTVSEATTFDGNSNLTGQNTAIDYKSGWFLDKIVLEGATPSQDKPLITFNYQSLASGYFSNITRITRSNNMINDAGGWNNYIYSNPYNASVVPAKSEISFNSTVSDNLAPLRIDFLDGTYWTFETDPLVMNPDTGAKILKSFKTFNSTSQLLEWRFDFSLTINDRLFLDSITKLNNGKEEKTLFSYKDKDLLPDNLSPFVDKWGYYTETEIVAYGIERELLNSRFVGFLTKITYPTGGEQSYVYEPTTYSYDANGLIPLEICKLENQMNWDPVQKSFNLSTAFSRGSPLYVEKAQEYYYERLSINSNNDWQNTAVKFEFSDGTTETISCELPYAKVFMPQGSATIRIVSTNINANFNFEFGLGWRESRPGPKHHLLGGGGVVSQIQLLDKNGTIEKSILYDYNESTNISSGAIDGLHDQITKDYDQTMEFILDSGECGAFTKLLSLNTQMSTVNLNSVGKNHVSFSKVEKKQIGMGRVVTNYTSPKDYHNDPLDFLYPYPEPINYNYKMGLPKESTIYNENGDKLSQNKTVYSFDEIPIATNFKLNTNYNKWKRFFNSWNAYSNYNGIPDNPMLRCASGYEFACASDCFGNQYTEPVNPHSFLNTTLFQTQVYRLNNIKQEYFYDDQSNLLDTLEAIVDYEYNPINYQINKVTTSNSKGEQLEQVSFFSVDSNLPISLTSQELITKQGLVDANMVTTPILQETYKNGNLTSRVKYNYQEFEPNQFLPVAVSTQKSVTDPMEPRLTYHDYDEYGNVLDVSKQDGTHVSYIYGYNSTLPIAKIEGLSFNQVAAKLGITEQQLESYDETNLIQINNLRNTFSVTDPFMVTTYEYEIGIGIKKVTDPRGRTMTYYYDDFNRLEYVTDHDGNMLSKNEYKYATQN